MYTESIETESALCAELISNHSTDMTDGEIKVVGKCPKCADGTIITKCCIESDDGNKCWSFQHYCDSCGEIFVPSRIRSDIFFNKPFSIKRCLSTPFGEIKVKINGKETEFRYRTDSYEWHGKPIPVGIIDIDVSQLKIDDTIFCGIDSLTFEYANSDENSVIHFCGNDELRLGFSAYDPDEYYDDYHCFIKEDCGLDDSFCYRIKSDPCLLDEIQYYKSKIISLAVSWVNIADYKDADDADTALFLALTLFVE